MAWTQSEVDQVRAAVLALATGARVVSVSYAPSGATAARTISYGIAQLAELRALLAEMDRQANTRPNFRRAAFSKGFFPHRGSGGC